MGRILSPTESTHSEKTQYFDALQSTSSSSQGQSVAMPDNSGNTTRTPNGNISGSKVPPPPKLDFSVEDSDPEFTGRHSEDLSDRRSPSLQSLPIWTEDRDEDAPLAGSMGGGRNTSLGRKASVRTTRSNRTTRSVAEATAAFQSGSVLTGPNAEPDVDAAVALRGVIAERSLSKKQKEKIVKDEQRESKRFSKLLKTESKLEQAALERALKSLAALQDLHKSACKLEAKAEGAYSKSLLAAQKAESTFLEARARAEEERARWEGKKGEVKAQEERLEAERENVREMEDRMAECAREIEKLRILKATDERERQAKMAEMLGKKT
ncbi:hypothetical protein DEU56DRAFT_41559 [Suillus clintonianus]|uniref:uncharacterized protein n=1 Tax=Suillus clintonianus TaxID=1904413 RepID=UPI001B87BF61|nr:uncharacterized protein DEU56DRAFT_41559 [Suillus clintonianus]KAG2124007.1 hypothetical protein DEU56DRAFT_41559 [Suillus clintonianus]